MALRRLVVSCCLATAACWGVTSVRGEEAGAEGFLSAAAAAANAAAATTPKTPFACIYDETGRSKAAHSSNEMTEMDARAMCCATHKYYVIGGQAESKNQAGKHTAHHNMVWCYDDVTRMTDHLSEDPAYCNIGCPGPKHDYNIATNGRCGGGCTGCHDQATCEAGPIPGRKYYCGRYRSVYSCNDAVPDLGKKA